MRGFDLSHWQEGLDITRIREAGGEFAILKITDGGAYNDPSAPHFYTQARGVGLPVGGYCYSHAINAPQARAEAAHILDTLMGFPVPLGLYLDVEEPEQLALPHADLLNVLIAWCDAIRAAGYRPGVYGSESTLWAKIRPEELPEDVLIWVAHYGKEPDVPCDLWQSSDSGSVPGYDGPVDEDKVRSAVFEALVLSGYGEPPASDACPIDGPCETLPDFSGAFRVLAAYLQTPEFQSGFAEYVSRQTD